MQVTGVIVNAWVCSSGEFQEYYVQSCTMLHEHGSVAADEELELPGMLDRCVRLITGVKKLVAEMRETVKNVVSHREKCAMLLSAAMAASVALDQVLYHLHLVPMPPYPAQWCNLHTCSVSDWEPSTAFLSCEMRFGLTMQALYTGNLGFANEKELQMLCTEVSSALALGETRIRVYGFQPRWKKSMKQLSGRQTERKFDEVVQQLARLTQQAWILQEGPNASSNSRCFHPL